MAAVAILVYLPKLKRGLGLAFGVHFLHDFSIKNIPYLIFYQLTKFQWHTFLFQDIMQNILLSSYCRELAVIYLQSSSKAMTGKTKT